MLSPENASQVVELAGWGEGYAFDAPSIRTGLIRSGGQTLVTHEFLEITQDSSHPARISYWELPVGELRLELLHPLNHQGIAVSPDGSRLATVRGVCPSDAEKCLLEVWDAPSGELEFTLELDVLQAIAFSPDNRRIALGAGSEVQIWDLSGARPVAFLAESSGIDRLHFSNDGSLLAGYIDITEKVFIWKVETGELLSALFSEVYAGAFFPSALAFSPGDAHLAVGFNGVVGLWSVTGWSEGLAWQGHNIIITKVAFSPDGRLVASGAEDGSIVLADPISGELLATLPGHDDYIWDLSFSADGRRLISTGLDGTLRFWGVPVE